jgi:glutaredoxin
VKELLSREAVSFTAYNVDEDDRAYDQLVARGYRTIPVTFFGDEAVTGYDVPALTAAISAWRGR